MVRFVIAAVAFTSALAAQSPIPPAQSSARGTGLVVGQVVDAETGRPVPGATISMTSNLPATPEEMVPGAVPQSRRVIANGDGRFMFHSVPPGRVNLSATAASYIFASPGQRRPQGPSPPVVLAEDERLPSVVIRMWKYAAIEGRVVDENNEPAVGIQVRVWRREWAGGRLRMTPGLNATTDDRGAYRIPQLLPGDYYVSVPSTQQTVPASVAQSYQELLDKGGAASTTLSRQLSSSGAPSAGQGGERIGDHILQSGRAGASPIRPVDQGDRMAVYPPTFAPSLDQDPIRLSSGTQHQNVDIALRLSPSVKVSGVLTGPEGPVAHVGVQLVQSRLFGNSSMFSGTETARTVTDANGAFTFLGVPADKYRLSVLLVPRPASTPTITTVSGNSSTVVMSSPSGVASIPAEPTLFAEMDLTVGEEDVTGLTVSVRQGARLTGTVVFNGTAAQPTPEQIGRMSIVLRPVAGGLMVSIPLGRVGEDMKISTAGYPAGRYFLSAPAPAPGWALESVMAGSRDVSRSGIEIGDTDVNVVLTFSDKRTEITGTVRSRAAASDPDAVVVAIPTNLRTWIDGGMNPRLTAVARTSPTGAYSIGGLPPGDYRVFAMSEDFAVDARDPAFLERLAALGTTLLLREGEKRALDLRTETPPRRSPSPLPSLSSSATTLDAPIDSVDVPVTSGPFASDQVATTPQAPARDVTSVTARGTGVIGGVVTTADEEKRPLRKVAVTLTGSSLRPNPITVTDDAGRYVFRNVPPGRYTLRASRPPYVDTNYGASRPLGAGTVLSLAEGQRLMDLAIPMLRGAAIEGTVFNEFGLPEERAQVTILQPRPGAEGPQLVITGGAFINSTDDRGRYRVFGLAPGEYIVAVRPAFSTGVDLTRITDADMRWATAALGPNRTGTLSPPSSQPIAAVPVFHPGVTDAEAARVIKVGAAEERTGVDVSLVTVAAAKITGRVVMADGRPPAQLQMSMMPESRVSLITPLIIVRPSADGSFQAQGVAPGKYVLTARAVTRGAGAAVPSRAGGRGGPTYDLWALHSVEVNGQDVTGLSLTLAPGLNVRGRFVFDATTATPPERFDGVQARLSPVSTSGVSFAVPPAEVGDDGTFTLTGVVPNTYRVAATAPGRTGQVPTWMLQSVVIGGRDVSDAPLVVTPDADIADVVVTMTDRVTEITGALLDATGRPAPELTIVVFPQDKAYWGRDSRRRPPPTRPGTDGKYRLTAVPPGDYYIVAVSELAFEEMYDFALLESLIPSAIKLSLGPGEKKTQDFKLSGK